MSTRVVGCGEIEVAILVGVGVGDMLDDRDESLFIENVDERVGVEGADLDFGVVLKGVFELGVTDVDAAEFFRSLVEFDFEFGDPLLSRFEFGFEAVDFGLVERFCALAASGRVAATSLATAVGRPRDRR